MRHIKPFPNFTAEERAELALKISRGSSAALSPTGNLMCNLFMGKWTDGRGYKKLRYKGHILYVHRAAYELTLGEIPDGYVLDHICKNRACCNPYHLEPITQRENILRGNNQNALMRNAVSSPNTTPAILTLRKRLRHAIRNFIWPERPLVEDLDR